MSKLLEGGYLREVNYRRGGLEKPALELEINPEHIFSLGLCLEPQRARALLVNALGVPVARHNLGPKSRDLAARLEALLGAFNIHLTKLGGVGVSLLDIDADVTALIEAEMNLGLPLFVETIAGLV